MTRRHADLKAPDFGRSSSSTQACTTDGKINGLVELRIANIIGFFINSINGNEVSGYIATIPGLFDPSAGIVPAENAFVKIVELIR